jgi:RNA polymerase sigma factor (sigma-70 family)
VFEDLTDDELLQQCRAGRQAAWSTLVRRFQRLVYTVAHRAGLSEAAADDVFQETFSRFLAHLDRIEDGTRIRAWLVTTAKRQTLDALAAQQRLADRVQAATGEADDPVEQVPDTQPLPEALLSELQQHHRVRAAVDRLDPRSRQFIELVFLQDEPVPYSEVARRLGIPEGSIGPTRARCLAKLRALLGEP